MTAEIMATTPADRDEAREKEVLGFLDNRLHREPVRAFVDAAITRIEQRLENDPAAVMGWEPVPLDLYGTPLPGSIHSSWVFILRANVASGAERHPNSRQRMMSYRGAGDLQTRTSDFWDSHALLSDPKLPLDQRWISIPENVWHQAVTPPANWAVVSFHTVPAEELIEERPDPDKPDSMRRKTYLERA
jgi:hypothetical protein